MNHLKIGDPYPWASARGLTGPSLPKPVWHALITAPQREKNTADKLNRAGVEVHYPTIEKTRHINGKARKYVRPMISQIIYAKFRYAPQWDVMRERRLISGVFSIGTTPLVLAPDDISRVMGLPTEADRLEAEHIEAERPKVGEQAEILSGPLNGFFVDVTRVESGRVWFETITGIKGSTERETIRRIAG